MIGNRRIGSLLIASFAVCWATGAAAQALVVSELRTAGPAGDTDEFVEIYNAGPTHTVAATDGSAGYSLVASDGAIRFTIPNGTELPAGGHYLGVNSSGFSLLSVPAGFGTTAAGDASWVADIRLNGGVALFKTANPASFTADNRLDAVGGASEPDALYKEGGGIPDLAPGPQPEHSFVRKLPGANAAAPGSCLIPGAPQDSGDNASDFVMVDTAGFSRRGSPGPQNLSSPMDAVPVPGFRAALALLDGAAAVNAAPNWELDSTPGAGPERMAGTLIVRRTFRNESGVALTRLRFRVVELSTSPTPPGVADLRALSAPAASVAVTGGSAAVAESVVEQPPAPVDGSGVNATFSVPGVSPSTPLAPGGLVNLQFKLGIASPGAFRFFVTPEASAPLQGQSWGVIGDTLGTTLPVDCGRTATSISITSPTPNVVLTQLVTFNATVATPAGAPTGTVAFKLGTIILGTVPVGASGLASFSTAALGLGNNQIYAEYSGDGAFLGSRSATPVTVRVSAAPTVPTPPASTPTPPADAGMPAPSGSSPDADSDAGTPSGRGSDGGVETFEPQSVQIKDQGGGCNSSGGFVTLPWLTFAWATLLRRRTGRKGYLKVAP